MHTRSCSAPTSCTWSVVKPALAILQPVTVRVTDKAGNLSIPVTNTQLVIV